MSSQKIAVMGYGVVGSGVVEAFYNSLDGISKKINDSADIKYILDIVEHKGTGFDEKFICCNAGDKAHYLIYKHSKKGMVLLVVAMNERTEAAVLKSIPRTVISK